MSVSTATKLIEQSRAASSSKTGAVLLRAAHKSICRAISSCTLCPLHSSRRQSVPGIGSLSARVMFIGEGPGRDEDRVGEPFIGRAGKTLDRLLQMIGWERSDVYVANTVSCRPPNNRTPEPEEMAACRGHVLSQISLVNPRIIVTLGATALMWFEDELGHRRVGDCHGEPFEWQPSVSDRSSIGEHTMPLEPRPVPVGSDPEVERSQAVNAATRRSRGDAFGLDGDAAGSQTGAVGGVTPRFAATDLAHPVHVFPMFHPAAALYNRELRPTLEADFHKLKSFSDNLQWQDEQSRSLPHSDLPFSHSPATLEAAITHCRSLTNLDIVRFTIRGRPHCIATDIGEIWIVPRYTHHPRLEITARDLRDRPDEMLRDTASVLAAVNLFNGKILQVERR